MILSSNGLIAVNYILVHMYIPYMFISHWSLFMCTKHVAMYIVFLTLKYVCSIDTILWYQFYVSVFTVCLRNVEYYFIFFSKQFLLQRTFNICFLSMLLLKFWLRLWVWNCNLLRTLHKYLINIIIIRIPQSITIRFVETQHIPVDIQ